MAFRSARTWTAEMTMPGAAAGALEGRSSRMLRHVFGAPLPAARIALMAVRIWSNWLKATGVTPAWIVANEMVVARSLAVKFEALPPAESTARDDLCKLFRPHRRLSSPMHGRCASGPRFGHFFHAWTCSRSSCRRPEELLRESRDPRPLEAGGRDRLQLYNVAPVNFPPDLSIGEAPKISPSTREKPIAGHIHSTLADCARLRTDSPPDNHLRRRVVAIEPSLLIVRHPPVERYFETGTRQTKQEPRGDAIFSRAG
jgi:hypothetical protein